MTVSEDLEDKEDEARQQEWLDADAEEEEPRKKKACREWIGCAVRDCLATRVC